MLLVVKNNNFLLLSYFIKFLFYGVLETIEYYVILADIVYRLIHLRKYYFIIFTLFIFKEFIFIWYCVYLIYFDRIYKQFSLAEYFILLYITFFFSSINLIAFIIYKIFFNVVTLYKKIQHFVLCDLFFCTAIFILNQKLMLELNLFNFIFFDIFLIAMVLNTILVSECFENAEFNIRGIDSVILFFLPWFNLINIFFINHDLELIFLLVFVLYVFFILYLCKFLNFIFYIIYDLLIFFIYFLMLFQYENNLISLFTCIVVLIYIYATYDIEVFSIKYLIIFLFYLLNFSFYNISYWHLLIFINLMMVYILFFILNFFKIFLKKTYSLKLDEFARIIRFNQVKERCYNLLLNYFEVHNIHVLLDHMHHARKDDITFELNKLQRLIREAENYLFIEENINLENIFNTSLHKLNLITVKQIKIHNMEHIILIKNNLHMSEKIVDYILVITAGDIFVEIINNQLYVKFNIDIRKNYIFIIYQKFLLLLNALNVQYINKGGRLEINFSILFKVQKLSPILFLDIYKVLSLLNKEKMIQKNIVIAKLQEVLPLINEKEIEILVNNYFD